MASVAICGGSVIGLATAMMLARDGHEVTVLEGDAAPPPVEAAAAWERWPRRGVAQFHQPHNLFARARRVMDDDLPGVTQRLVDAGGIWIDPLSRTPPTLDLVPEDDDDRFRFVNARRPTIEAVFANAAAAQEGLTVRRGGAVRGLRWVARTGGVPHVTGVVLDDGDAVSADLVVDAMGRRSNLTSWLESIGAPPPQVESQDSGFVYYTRYFRGVQPTPIAPPLSPMGSISLLTLLSDNGTWSVTIFTASDDKELHVLRDPKLFERIVAACPLHAHWLEGERLTDVAVMAGVLDKYRRLIVDGRPVVTGVVPVGDAWACTNPSAGRGISVGLVHAQCLRDVVREGMVDADSFSHRYDSETDERVTPFYRDQLAADRIRLAEMSAIVRGSQPPPPDPHTAAVGVAMMKEPEVFRGVIETVTCLAFPRDVFARPQFQEKVAPYVGQVPSPLPGPDRARVVALLAGSPPASG